MKLRRQWILGLAIALFSAGFVVACKDDSPTANYDGPIMAANFSLEDLNDSSMTFQEAISPRDYLGSISAWYFGHST